MAHGKFPLKSVLIEKCPATPLYFILKSPLAFDWKHIFIIVSLANRKVIYFHSIFEPNIVLSTRMKINPVVR